MIIELNAVPEDIMKAVEILNQYCLEKKIPEKIIFSLKLVLEECGSNIINHSLKNERDKKISVFMKKTDNLMIIELRDHGAEFDPTKTNFLENGNSSASEGGTVGGWGLKLVRQNIDEMHYIRSENTNILTLKKYLPLCYAERSPDF